MCDNRPQAAVRYSSNGACYDGSAGMQGYGQPAMAAMQQPGFQPHGVAVGHEAAAGYYYPPPQPQFVQVQMRPQHQHPPQGSAAYQDAYDRRQMCEQQQHQHPHQQQQHQQQPQQQQVVGVPVGPQDVQQQQQGIAMASGQSPVLSLNELPPPKAVGGLPAEAPVGMDELVQFTAIALQHSCEEMRVHERGHQSIFHSSRIPAISIWDYVRRIGKYSACSPECFITALEVLDRYSKATGIPLSFRNIHRLTITTVMVSAKLHDDIHYSNAYYASIGGVSCSELWRLELELLSTISWNTWVEPDYFYQYVGKVKAIYGPFMPLQPSPS